MADLPSGAHPSRDEWASADHQSNDALARVVVVAAAAAVAVAAAVAGVVV